MEIPLKRTKRPDLTSDPENEEAVPQAFKAMVHGSAVVYLDNVIVEYEEDKYLFLLKPEELGKFLSPRNTFRSTYLEKDRLEKGMQVRCMWDGRQRFCKAKVLELGACYNDMYKVFVELETARKSDATSTRPAAGTSISRKRVKASDKAETDRVKRADLNSRALAGFPGFQPTSLQAVLLETHKTSQNIRKSRLEKLEERSGITGIQSKSAADSALADDVGSLSEPGPAFEMSAIAIERHEPVNDKEQGHQEEFSTHADGLNEHHPKNQKKMQSEDADTQTEETNDTVTQDADMQTFLKQLQRLHTYRRTADDLSEKKPMSVCYRKKLERFDRKIRKIEDWLEYKSKTKSYLIGLNHTKTAKIAVAPLDWSFTHEPEEDEKSNYRNVGAPLWVKKADLNDLRKDAESLKEYGNKLLWGLLFTWDDFVLARREKQRSVGFAKLFGAQNIKALYVHLSRHRERMMVKNPASQKWAKEMPSKKVLKRKWCKGFDDRMRLATSRQTLANLV